MSECREYELPDYDDACRFPVPDLDTWSAEATAALKGGSFEKRLLTPLPEGITLRPLYTEADTRGDHAAESYPGEAPFLRGARALGHVLDHWEIAQELPIPTPGAYNEALRRDLDQGQTAAVLVLDAAGRRGIDPDLAPAGEIGRSGTSIATTDDLDRALSGVDLERVPLFLHAGAATLPAATLLVALLRRRGTDVTRLRGSLGSDPLSDALAAGTPFDLGSLLDDLAVLTEWAHERAPEVKTLTAWGAHWHDAGANAVEELAWTIASAVHTLRGMEERGIPPARAAERFLLGFAVGPRLQIEVAKLRAARLLWARVTGACGCGEAAASLFLHARTSTANLSAIDPHTNILRTTTEAVAAVLGGCDGVTVLPFDRPRGLPSELARRLARNTQLILREESRLDRVIDAAGGAWALESLTRDLAERAWDLFRGVESEGGLCRLLEAGLPQARVAEAAAARRQAVATRREILVGVNRYPNDAEEVAPAAPPDYGAIAAQRAAVLRGHRAGAPSHAAAAAAMLLVRERSERFRAGRAAGLPAATGTAPDLFEAAVTAALRGGTLGELMAALRGEPARAAGEGSAAASVDTRAEGPARETGPRGPVNKATAEDLASPPPPAIVRFAPLAARRLTLDFERLRAEVHALRATGGLAGSTSAEVFLAGLGPEAAYQPRLEFTRSFFALAGFRVDGGVEFHDADTAVAAAVLAGAPVVCIVSTDERYPASVPPLAEAIKRARPDTQVVLAGLPDDPDRIQAYRDAGVDEFIHARSDAPEVLAALVRRLGGRA